MKHCVERRPGAGRAQHYNGARVSNATLAHRRFNVLPRLQPIR